MTSRRAFVGRTAQAVAGLALARRWPGQERTVVAVTPAMTRGGVAAAALFPGEMAPLDLAGLAARALDAAKSAGAGYADIRLTQQFQILYLDAGGRPVLEAGFGYGIRVVVEGASAFVHGCVPDVDRVTAAARDAVATARGYAAIKVAPVELAATPAVQGEWTTPIHGDPFLIPLNDQSDLTRSYDAMGDRVTPHEYLEINITGGINGAEFNWTKELRVFAATDGSLLRQTLYRSEPHIHASGDRSYLGYTSVYLPHLAQPRSGGYETVYHTDMPEQLKAAADLARATSQMPRRRFDVGRFPVVVDGAVLGSLFGRTVGMALELDRALGNESGTTGSSFLAPPAQILGKTVIHPALNVTASRAMPHFQAVKWDDEGVEPADYPVLKEGVVVDYHTSRDTAPALAAWYQGQGRPVQSHGCATAADGGKRVVVQMPHLTMHAATGSASAEDLYRGMARGLYIPQHSYLSVDQQLSGGLLFPGEAFEVVRGKIVGRVKDVGVDFGTVALWKALTALGGAETMRDTSFQSSKGIPWQESMHTVSAPAGMFSGVRVVDLGRALS